MNNGVVLDSFGSIHGWTSVLSLRPIVHTPSGNHALADSRLARLMSCGASKEVSVVMVRA